jgi:hypothetical protein
MAKVAATIAKKIYRGALIRESGTGDAQKEKSAPKIPLPAFFFLLFVALAADLIDLLEFIPVLGSLLAFVFGMILGAILWITYWALGARSLSAIVAMAVGVILELIPGISTLPFNVIVAVLVYLITNSKLIERLKGIVGGLTGKTIERSIKIAAALKVPA